MEAAVASGKSGALRRAVYHVVADDEMKNLRDCVRRIDGAVRVDGWGLREGGRKVVGLVCGGRSL